MCVCVFVCVCVCNECVRSQRTSQESFLVHPHFLAWSLSLGWNSANRLAWPQGFICSCLPDTGISSIHHQAFWWWLKLRSSCLQSEDSIVWAISVVCKGTLQNKERTTEKQTMAESQNNFSERKKPEKKKIHSSCIKFKKKKGSWISMREELPGCPGTHKRGHRRKERLSRPGESLWGWLMFISLTVAVALCVCVSSSICIS